MPANNRRSVRPHASEESSCLGPGFHPGHSAATHLGEAGVPLPRCATSAPAPNPSPRSPNSSNLPGAAADTAATYGPFWGLLVPALNPGTAMRDVKPGGEEAVAEVTELLDIAPPATSPLAGWVSYPSAGLSGSPQPGRSASSPGDASSAGGRPGRLDGGQCHAPRPGASRRPAQRGRLRWEVRSALAPPRKGSGKLAGNSCDTAKQVVLPSTCGWTFGKRRRAPSPALPRRGYASSRAASSRRKGRCRCHAGPSAWATATVVPIPLNWSRTTSGVVGAVVSGQAQAPCPVMLWDNPAAAQGRATHPRVSTWKQVASRRSRGDVGAVRGSSAPVPVGAGASRRSA